MVAYRRLLLPSLICCLACLTCGESNHSTNPSVTPPASPSIPGILRSAYVGDSLRIYTGLPEGFDPERSEPYHSVYLLDGDWYFDGTHWRYEGEGVLGLLDDLVKNGTGPESVLIGIGYEGTGDNERGRDYHVRFERFHNFVKLELMPLVDSVCNTGEAAGRTIMGHSSGAYAAMRFFVRYGLFPGHEFHNFIALSGDFSHDDLEVYKDEARLCARLGGPQSSLPVNMFLAAGSLEEDRFLTSLATMTDSLESRQYQDFRLKSRIYGNVGHGTHWRGFPNGLKWVFDWSPTQD